LKEINFDNYKTDETHKALEMTNKWINNDNEIMKKNELNNRDKKYINYYKNLYDMSILNITNFNLLKKTGIKIDWVEAKQTLSEKYK